MTDPFGGPDLPPAEPWSMPPWPTPAPRAATPATVQAAVIVTYVCCALAALMTIVLLAGAAFVGSLVLDSFERADRLDIVLAVLGTAAFSMGACVLACWLAWQVGRRRRWARIALAAWSGIALVLSVAAPGPPTMVVLPGSAAVLILLFVPQSNAWFRADS